MGLARRFACQLLLSLGMHKAYTRSVCTSGLVSVRKSRVREARQHFRRLLDRVQAGDEVVVTRRGVEVARLVRPQRKAPRPPDLDSLRASVKVAGRPLSREIVESRRSGRF